MNTVPVAGFEEMLNGSDSHGRSPGVMDSPSTLCVYSYSLSETGGEVPLFPYRTLRTWLAGPGCVCVCESSMLLIVKFQSPAVHIGTHLSLHPCIVNPDTLLFPCRPQAPRTWLWPL